MTLIAIISCVRQLIAAIRIGRDHHGCGRLVRSERRAKKTLKHSVCCTLAYVRVARVVRSCYSTGAAAPREGNHRVQLQLDRCLQGESRRTRHAERVVGRCANQNQSSPCVCVAPLLSQLGRT